MRYVSTRNSALSVEASEAVTRGLSLDGGLFVPEKMPHYTDEQIADLCKVSYNQRAAYVMKSFLDEFTAEELVGFADEAYADNFDDSRIAPLHQLDGNTLFLELWHGPTSAFKDMALQMLPRLLTASLVKRGDNKKVVILAATSGDTGKAAMEGFRDVDGTAIMTFYPHGGVSQIQAMQMNTQEGANVQVCAVKGNFDDAQRGVKQIFSDSGIRQKLLEKGMFLSSANSINWGRILAQIVYYFSAYCDTVNCGAVKLGAPVNFCVPTGNFGNILAAYYARQMGLPVGRLICASNANNVLTEFIRTGRYDRRREFHITLSPSMDILVSSNLERLLYDLSGRSDEEIRGYMSELDKNGEYQVKPALLDELQKLFWADFCDDVKTEQVIRDTYGKYGYLIDPHTAVAYAVLDSYRADTGDTTPAVVVSTASPYKFCDSVLKALGEAAGDDPLERLDRLSSLTGTAVPAPLAALRTKKPRFDAVIEKEAMPKAVLDFCNS